jgi:hypothetical protein
MLSIIIKNCLYILRYHLTNSSAWNNFTLYGRLNLWPKNFPSLWKNIGFYNRVFQLQRTLATHGIYTALSANGQITAIITDILCCIEYHIYNAIHMQLYATNLHVRFSHTFQCDKRNANVAFHPFVDRWCMLIPFATYLQLVWKL